MEWGFSGFQILQSRVEVHLEEIRDGRSVTVDVTSDAAGLVSYAVLRCSVWIAEGWVRPRRWARRLAGLKERVGL